MVRQVQALCDSGEDEWFKNGWKDETQRAGSGTPTTTSTTTNDHASEGVRKKMVMFQITHNQYVCVYSNGGTN